MPTDRTPQEWAQIAKYKMTPEEKEAQRRSFAYGNVHIHNPAITREMIDEAAERLRRAS